MMVPRISPRLSLVVPIALSAPTTMCAPALQTQDDPAYGRWDMTAYRDGPDRAMWLELTPGSPPTGRIQGWWRHAIPVGEVTVREGTVEITLPENWLSHFVRFEAEVQGDELTGTLIDRDGLRVRVVGVRAPSLERAESPEWGDPVDLLASGLEAWRIWASHRNGWSMNDGELVNVPLSSNLISLQSFDDFKLSIEVNVPPDGDSGIYLRGRYEVQVQDDFGEGPHSRRMGGIYGQVTPQSLPASPAGEWQKFEITLVGRRVTVELNGQTILDGAEIPGITGGALNSDEGAAGPLMLQGDHTAVRYRNIIITPARDG